MSFGFDFFLLNIFPFKDFLNVFTHLIEINKENDKQIRVSALIIGQHHVLSHSMYSILK